GRFFSNSVHIPYSLAVATAITWINRVRQNCKLILIEFWRKIGDEGEFGSQMVADVRTWREVRPQEGTGDRCLAVAQKRGGRGPSGRHQSQHTAAVDQGAGV